MRHKMTINSTKIVHSQWYQTGLSPALYDRRIFHLFVLLFKENMINFAIRYTTLRQIRRAIQRRSTISTAQLGVMLLVPRSRAGG